MMDVLNGTIITHSLGKTQSKHLVIRLISISEIGQLERDDWKFTSLLLSSLRQQWLVVHLIKPL